MRGVQVVKRDRGQASRPTAYHRPRIGAQRGNAVILARGRACSVALRGPPSFVGVALCAVEERQLRRGCSRSVSGACCAAGSCSGHRPVICRGVEMLIAEMTATGEHTGVCLRMRLIRQRWAQEPSHVSSPSRRRRRAFAAWYERAQSNGEVMSPSHQTKQPTSTISSRSCFSRWAWARQAELVVRARRAMSALDAL